MRKIKLHLESIAVESFHTTRGHSAAGTAVAHQWGPFSGLPETCGATCGRTCWQSCNGSCDEATCVSCPSACQACITPGCPGDSGYRCTDNTCYWVC
jgi:hypothetical protein